MLGLPSHPAFSPGGSKANSEPFSCSETLSPSRSCSELCGPHPATHPFLCAGQRPPHQDEYLLLGAPRRPRPTMQEMQETQVRSLGQEDPLEEGMATHSSILALRIPWTEEPSELQSTGSQRAMPERLSMRTCTGGLSRYPDLTGAKLSLSGQTCVSTLPAGSLVWVWWPAGLFTPCVLTSISLPWRLFGLKTEAGAGCGLQGEFLSRGPLNHQHVDGQRKMVLAGGCLL